LPDLVSLKFNIKKLVSIRKLWQFKDIAIVFFLLSIGVSSCRSPIPCPEKMVKGNAGSIVNTGGDDYLPVIFENSLYFISVKDIKSKKEQLYRAKIKEDTILQPVADTTLPLFKFTNYTTPSFYHDKATNDVDIYFAAADPKNKINRDIYTARMHEGKWSTVKPMEGEINTENFETHPAISSDGKTLVFVSNRQGSIGETDIYVTHRQSDGSWSKPENLGPEINTPAMEITPFIDSDGNLYFSSKGYRQGFGSDIVKAEPNGKGMWKNPQLLPKPVNSEADDAGPFVVNDKIFLSSNRTGGCGSFDIYDFILCGPVFFDGSVESKGANVPLAGKLELDEPNGQKYLEYIITSNGKFNFEVEPNRDYIVKYSNACVENLMTSQTIQAPCSDSSTVKINLKIELPENFYEFLFESYKVPFFVTGYYMPNTTDNLMELRHLFEKKKLGATEDTKYIENPGTNYDIYTEIVGKSIADAVKFIQTRLKFLSSACSGENDKLKITVTGFADPRPISETAKYIGEEISDKEYDFYVKPGDKMDNELLSKLRAYNSARTILTDLYSTEEYKQFENRIVWEIVGKGVDPDETVTNEYKRRVNIKIGIVQD
jgi:hypothetical protein